jgi:hypothetical protein
LFSCAAIVVSSRIAFGAGFAKVQFRFTANTSTGNPFMDESKIMAAAQACLSDALKSDKPFRSINESLAMLKRCGWTDAERLEIQTQVLQEFKRRRTQGQEGGVP